MTKKIILSAAILVQYSCSDKRDKNLRQNKEKLKSRNGSESERKTTNSFRQDDYRT